MAFVKLTRIVNFEQEITEPVAVNTNAIIFMVRRHGPDNGFHTELWLGDRTVLKVVEDPRTILTSARVEWPE